REPRAEGDRRRAEAPRPCRRGRSRLVGRPPDSRLESRTAPPCCRQSARHARLRGRPLASSMTWSIIANDSATGQIGIAVATKFFAVGARVPHIAAGIGAIATQALVNPYYGIDGVRLLREGRSPQDIIATLIAGDDGRDSRQLHIMDADDRIAVHTGKYC